MVVCVRPAADQRIGNLDQNSRAVTQQRIGTNRTAVIDLLDIIDSVARTLGDFTVVPEQSEIAKDFATQDEHRLAGIRAFEEAQLDLGDADGVINELRSLLPDETSPQPGEVQNHFTNAGEALVDGIRGLGGNPDAPSEEDH
jgi:hypothetical protein